MTGFSRIGVASVLALALGAASPLFAQDRIVVGSSGVFKTVTGPITLDQRGGDNVLGLIQFGPTASLDLDQTGDYNRAVFVQMGASVVANVDQTGNGVNRTVGFQNAATPVGFVTQNGDDNFGFLFQNTLNFAGADRAVVEDMVLSLLFGPETVPIGAEVARRTAERVTQDLLSEFRYGGRSNPCFASVDPAQAAPLVGTPCSLRMKVYGRLGVEDAEDRLGILPYETDSMSAGATAWIDFSPRFSAGAAFDKTRSDIAYPGVIGDAELDTTNFSLMGQVRYRNAYATVAGTYGFADLETTRGRGRGTQARGDTGGSLYAVAGEAGYQFDVTDTLTLTPYADITHSSATFEGYTETGNPLLTQIVGKVSDDALTVGVGASGHFTLPNVASGLSLSADIALKNRLDGEGVDRFFVVQPFFSGAPMATPLDRDADSTWVEAGAGVELNITEKLAVGLVYDGSFGGDVESHSGAARLRFDF